MHNLNRAVCFVLIDQNRDADFRSCNHLNVDAGIIKRLKHIRSHAHMSHHAGAHQADFCHIVVYFNAVVANGIPILLKYIFWSGYIPDIKVDNLKIDLAVLEDDVSFTVK